MHAVLTHTFKKRRYAFLALGFVWVLAYLYSFGPHLRGEDLRTVIYTIPSAMLFGWGALPGNIFRVITGVEPNQSLAWPLIIIYWLVMLSLQIAFLWSKRSLILILILVVLLVSTHGCYQWANQSLAH